MKPDQHAVLRTAVIARAVGDGRIPDEPAARSAWGATFDKDTVAACNALDALPRGVHRPRPTAAAAPAAAALPTGGPVAAAAEEVRAAAEGDAAHRAFMLRTFPQQARAMGYEAPRADIAQPGFGMPMGTVPGVTGA